MPYANYDNAFFEIYVHNNPKGGSVVHWGMRRQFHDAGPYEFTLQWAEAASVNDDEWETITTVVDTYFAVDPEPRQFAREIESFYRLILVTPEGRYVSFAQQATGIWTKRDWLIVRDICRKEMLVAKKYTGRNGWLLKRKVWGPKCPRCADFDTEEVGDGHCPVCFGTGIVGGYWPGYRCYPYEMQGGPQQRHKQLDDQVGMRDDQMMQFRMVSYPHISTYDIFVEEGSGDRYAVRNVSTVAEMRGIPVVNVFEARQIPYTDIAYNVPVNPVVPPYVPDDIPVTTEAVESEDFPPLPPTPPLPAEEIEIIPEEEEPVVEEETQFETAPKYSIWWSGDQWYVSSTIGDTEDVLYRTTDAIGNPFFMNSFNWIPVNAGASDTISFGLIANGVTITSTTASVSGNYIQAGTYEGMFVYLQE